MGRAASRGPRPGPPGSLLHVLCKNLHFGSAPWKKCLTFASLAYAIDKGFSSVSRLIRIRLQSLAHPTKPTGLIYHQNTQLKDKAQYNIINTAYMLKNRNDSYIMLKQEEKEAVWNYD